MEENSMENEKIYITPEMEITEFETEDIIVTSPGNETPFEPV